MAIERDNVVYWKTKGKINNDLQWLYNTTLVQQGQQSVIEESSREGSRPYQVIREVSRGLWSTGEKQIKTSNKKENIYANTDSYFS